MATIWSQKGIDCSNPSHHKIKRQKIAEPDVPAERMRLGVWGNQFW